MEITFKKLDEEISDIMEPAREVVTWILNSSHNILSIFSEVLLNCKTYTNQTFVDKKIVKRINEYKDLYTDITDEIEKLADAMWSYFSYIDDVNFDLKIRTTQNHYRDLQTEQKKLNKLRGTLFEVLVEEIIKPRYKNADFGTGCMLIIDNDKVISKYDNKIRKTIDVAGIENRKGEFYECKLSPKVLDESSYMYLCLLEDKLREDNNFKYIIGYISLEEKEAVENKKSQIENSLNIKNPKITVFGNSEILQLRELPDEIAI